MSSNLVIVAVPDENDRVWKVSSEQVPHLTLLFLGDSAQVSNLESIMQFVEHAADTMLRRFYLPVDRRDVLGADSADVLFFKKGRYDFKAVRDFRAALLQDSNIKTAYDSATQFEGPWQPHLTLGYPATPAKSDSNEHDKFYDVSFNKIAVWTGDFQGPEFLLKDYWDEGDDEIDAPVNLAMSSMNQDRVQAGMALLEHFGVKGMKWGVVTRDKRFAYSERQQAKANQLKEKAAAPGTNVLKRNFLQNRAQSKQLEATQLKEAVTQEVMAKTNRAAKKDVAALRKRPEFQNINYRDKDNRPQFDTAKFQNLQKEQSQIWLGHLNKSVAGQQKFEVTTKGDTWELTAKQVQHAVNSVLVVRPIRDEDGFLIDVELVDPVVENPMTVNAIHGEEFVLEHFGIKGMKWGVRNAAAAVGRGAKKIGSGLAAMGAVMADSAWQGSTYNDVKHEAVHNHVAKELDNHIERLQRAPKYRGKDLKADADLRKTYYQDVAKVTNSAYRRAVKETYGENYTGTKSAHYATDARGQRIEVRNKKTGEVASESPLTSMKDIQKNRAAAAGVTHAATTDFPDLTIDLTIDADGQISGVGFVRPSETTMAQTAAHGEAFVDGLVHFGIKGMKWGVRKPPPAPVTATATSRVPHGAKRKTKIEAQGGENHPAHQDAIQVAEAKAKLAKSGTAALSNKELRDVANRVQLEQQVKQLVQPKGKKFVKKLLGQQGNQAANEVVGKQVKRKLATAALI